MIKILGTFCISIGVVSILMILTKLFFVLIEEIGIQATTVIYCTVLLWATLYLWIIDEEID